MLTRAEDEIGRHSSVKTEWTNLLNRRTFSLSVEAVEESNESNEGSDTGCNLEEESLYRR